MQQISWNSLNGMMLMLMLLLLMLLLMMILTRVLKYPSHDQGMTRKIPRKGWRTLRLRAGAEL
eukprot:447237-Rhodomonas_salina.1